MISTTRRRPAPPAHPTLSAIPDTPHAQGDCAAVVTCHNYARYLPTCLDSILAQTRPVDHLVVVDDASDDDTPAVCASYAARGVRYLRTEHRDASLARNAGVAALPRTRFVIFIDADNYLAPDYLERLYAPMADPTVAVAYAELMRINDAGEPLGRHTWIAPFNHWKLRIHNYADTCSLVRREAFDHAGGWMGGQHYGLQDWLLWLRITRLGWRMQYVPEAVLFYRTHAATMSTRYRDEPTRGLTVMRHGMLTTVLTLFSGREWMLERWFAALKAVDWPAENLHLVALDNSSDAGFSRRLRMHLAGLPIGSTYVRVPDQILDGVGADEFAGSRRHRVANAYQMNMHLSKLYAIARGHLPAATDLVWSIEDDITVPPDALSNLSMGLYNHHDAGVCAGVIRNRFVDRLLVWEQFPGQQDGGTAMSEVPHDGYRPVVATGFGCTLLRRQVLDGPCFRPSRDWSDRHVAYDWAFAEDAQAAGWRWLLAGAVHCGHWEESGTCLLP